MVIDEAWRNLCIYTKARWRYVSRRLSCFTKWEFSCHERCVPTNPHKHYRHYTNLTSQILPSSTSQFPLPPPFPTPQPPQAPQPTLRPLLNHLSILNPAAIALHLASSTHLTRSIHLARSIYLARSDGRLADELDLRTFEVLAPVEEPLHRADDEDDEEGDNAVI